jgi:hypothetical protein
LLALIQILCHKNKFLDFNQKWVQLIGSGFAKTFLLYIAFNDFYFFSLEFKLEIK